MSEEQEQPVITPLPSLMEFGRQVKEGRANNETEELFYTCPQCGHAMVTKKCKIVCYHCHYFIGCVE
jgi:rubrerythrin